MKIGRKKSGHSNHIAHPDEKWLVSYSDMMTLLFGFFVLMYALAAESPKGTNAALAEIAEAMAGKPKEATTAAPPPVMAKITEEELQKIKDRLAELEKLLAQRQVDMEALQAKYDEQIKNLPVDSAINPEEFESLKKKVTDLTSEIEKKNNEIKDLNTEVKNKNNEIAALKKKLDELKSNNFMMVFTKWDTEKHDLDLTVKTPNGKLYNFKNRKYAELPGELVLDSRYGPGAEIWNSNSVVPGDYELNVTLYNQYGNLNDAVVETGIVSSLSNIKLPTVRLNQRTQPSVVYRFSIDNEGRININKPNNQ